MLKQARNEYYHIILNKYKEDIKELKGKPETKLVYKKAKIALLTDMKTKVLNAEDEWANGDLALYIPLNLKAWDEKKKSSKP